MAAEDVVIKLLKIAMPTDPKTVLGPSTKYIYLWGALK